MKKFIALFFMLSSFALFAGPRVVGNGFVANKEDPTIKLEEKLRHAKSKEDRFILLNEIVKQYSSANYEVNKKNIINIEDNAKTTLNLSNTFRKNALYADVIHHANIALGRAALFSTDLESALYYLESSIKLYGLEKIKSPAPNMTLAKELLKVGKKNEVLDYLEDSLKLWSDKTQARKKINEWKKAIYEDEVPDFKENLDY